MSVVLEMGREISLFLRLGESCPWFLKLAVTDVYSVCLWWNNGPMSANSGSKHVFTFGQSCPGFWSCKAVKYLYFGCLWWNNGPHSHKYVVKNFSTFGRNCPWFLKWAVKYLYSACLWWNNGPIRMNTYALRAKFEIEQRCPWLLKFSVKDLYFACLSWSYGSRSHKFLLQP